YPRSNARDDEQPPGLERRTRPPDLDRADTRTSALRRDRWLPLRVGDRATAGASHGRDHLLDRQPGGALRAHPVPRRRVAFPRGHGLGGGRPRRRAPSAAGALGAAAAVAGFYNIQMVGDVTNVDMGLSVHVTARSV